MSQKLPFREEIQLRGHIIDSWMLPRVFEVIMDHGGEFELQTIQVGKKKDEPSFVKMQVAGPSPEVLSEILDQLQELGAEMVSQKDAATQPAPK